MPQFLDFLAAGFKSDLQAVVDGMRDDQMDVGDVVAQIIADVRTRGDAAVAELTEKFDHLPLTPDAFRLTPEQISAYIATVPADEKAALDLAAQRIKAYHAKQRPEDMMWDDESGATLGWRWSAVDAAGLYVPGGLASYPSSVLMNAIPAKVAGVKRLAMTVPTPRDEVNPLVIYAAHIAGVDEIHRIGGAQAIAALAYGTQTIAPVDLITGPGNAFVAEAKRRVFGHVGIDMIAGPSEILVIADADNDPDWIAIDLLSQAEHDKSAASILITTDAQFAQDVAAAVTRRLETLERREIASASWADHGLIITVPDLARAAEVSNILAPEHLELCVADPDALLEDITHAGAVFMGKWTPEAIGDYIGGPNHVLPTSRSARFSSGLSTLTFMKRTTISKMSPQALSAIGPAAVTLAQSESLEAHGLSVSERLKQLNQ